MRATLRLLAQVKYLEPGAPTGLTGIVTHAAPRSALLYLYNSTLDKLQRFPEHSVYRQSTEALTKHRLAIVESVKPAGLQEWQDRVRSTVQANPNAFHQVKSITTGEVNYVFKADIARGLIEDQLDAEDVGFEPSGKPEPEGPRTATEKAHHGRAFTENLRAQRLALPKIEPEPPLTSEQIETIEQQVGAGLIEEIIEVAEGENTLVDELFKSEVWADLCESPAEAQWQYHERRGTHVPETQSS